MQNYEIHFNTAATRSYGVMILSILKCEISMQKARMEMAAATGKDEAFRKQIDMTFDKNRLITRDDKARFAGGDDNKIAIQNKQIEAIRQAEKNITNHGNLQITSAQIERELLKLNYTRKTLDALAGGDDTIFVIIDDREDVWLNEQRRPVENLLKVPAYYHYEDTHVKPYQN